MCGSVGGGVTVVWQCGGEVTVVWQFGGEGRGDLCGSVECEAVHQIGSVGER